MNRPNYMEQVDKRIASFASGTVFTVTDFADITDAKTIHMSLTRLSREGKNTKIMRGIYFKPRYSRLLLEEIPVRQEDIARAIARNYGWTIVPSEATALNILGLSTQVPAVWEFISDGPYKEYTYNEIKISFKHTNKNTELTQVSCKTALIIRAIKALGKDGISEETIKTLAAKITASEKQTLLKEAQFSTSWVYETIKVICRKENPA